MVKGQPNELEIENELNASNEFAIYITKNVLNLTLSILECPYFQMVGERREKTKTKKDHIQIKKPMQLQMQHFFSYAGKVRQ